MLPFARSRDRPRSDRHQRFVRRMRMLRWSVLSACLVVGLGFMGFKLARYTGGSVEKLDQLPDLLGRLQKPIDWSVPEDGVRYLLFFHGYPEDGRKFVLVRVRMEARLKIGYPVVPRCFELVTDDGTRYYPMSRSPMFIRLGERFHLDRDDTIDEELLFEIPEEARAERLTFERYHEPSE